MTTLRQFFIVDELEDAALKQDSNRLTVVREIIRRIKLSQLDAKKVADDEMILDVLRHYQSELTEQLDLVERYLNRDTGQ